MSTRIARGFTLIEMVVALAILGLSLSTIYAIFESALSRIQHDARLSEATLIAKSLLARGGTEVSPFGGPLNGKWKEFSYELIPRPADISSEDSSVSLQSVEVTATVSWVEFTGKRSISLSTLKLSPRKLS